MGMVWNKSKFVFSETFNNSNGKTSGSGFIGVITGLTGSFLILAGIFAFFFKYSEALEFLTIGLKLIGISAGILAARKAGGQLLEAKNGKTPETIEVPDSEKG